MPRLPLLVVTSIASAFVALPALADALSPTVPVNSNAGVDSGADHHPSIAMDAAGRAVVVWTSTDSLGGTIGTDADILFARSLDLGVTWTPVAPITALAATDGANEDRNVAIATDRNNTYVAAWQTRGMFGPDRDVVFARSVDGGATWSAPALLDTGGATDADDDITPRLATDGNGRWIAVWASGIAEMDVLYTVSIDNGLTWSAPAQADPLSGMDVDQDLDPVVAASETGSWMIAWASNSIRTGVGTADFDILMVRSNNDGLSWSAPALLNTNGTTDAGDDRAVDLAADGTGRWLATWHEHGSYPWGPDGDILVARSLNDGAVWSQPRAIYSFAMIELGDEQDPRISTDRQGNWNVVWWREDSLPGGVGQDVDILQARSIDGGVSWIGPELINNDAFNDVGNDWSPAIANDRTGNWRVVWHSDDSLGGTIGTDLDIVTAGAVCGDGFVQLAEQCDDGNRLAGDCCTPTCQLAPAMQVCRNAGTGCDTVEYCNGVDGFCPPDAVVVAGTPCRTGTGACDPTEVCDGASPLCPANTPAPAGTPCRDAASLCDAPEVCTGASNNCPADAVAPAGAVCRASADACDAEETCNGVSANCPVDGVVAAGTLCRAAAGVCDLAETCDGVAAACPTDARVGPGVMCRASHGICDASENCAGGVDCPVDQPLLNGVSCADSVVCDGSEICMAGACVAGAALACDDGNACTAESCSEPGGCGSSPVPGCCNTNAACDDGNACTIDVCSGAGGACTHTLIPGCCNGNADCNDLDSCTVDVCSGPGGTCGSTEITNCCASDADCPAVACGTTSCNVASERCETTPIANCCTQDSDCNDGNACTTNTCDTASGACVSAPVADCCNSNADCNDDDACTADVCSGPGGTCGSTAIANCCTSDAQCNDGNACTTDTCDPQSQRCVAAAVAGCCAVDADCAAGPVCTTVSCVQGQCEQAPTPNCCTLDSECDDGNACTFDQCSQGTCVRSDACGPDAGVSPDGAVVNPGDDAAVGPGADGGVVNPGDDAAVGPDGAVVNPGDDAAVNPGDDAAVGPDAGVSVDSGSEADAGSSPDAAGSGVDAGSAQVDSGDDDVLIPDDGLEYDDDGCECTALTVRHQPTAPWGVLAMLCAAVVVRTLRRRR